MSSRAIKAVLPRPDRQEKWPVGYRTQFGRHALEISSLGINRHRAALDQVEEPERAGGQAGSRSLEFSGLWVTAIL
jgi:hypothetical protein